MTYWSNSEQDLNKMLEAIGVRDYEELIAHIPGHLRMQGEYPLPPALSEMEVSRLMQNLADRNRPLVCFAGGGSYDHYIPAIVDAIASRAEYYTSYTPYQAEVSQGNLQVMYEFQSMICELTGMEVTNASMYEGGSALAEAVLLAVNHNGRKKVVIPATLNPGYREVIDTYIRHMELDCIELPEHNGLIDVQALAGLNAEEVSCVVVQNPNYFGFLENLEALNEWRRGKGALLIYVYQPVSLGILAPPGEFGSDIAVAEGQPLGNPCNFGGPYVGFFSTTAALLRKIPGRIAGVTQDVEGRRGFVLTLQTREQHIRREKATSNICTNSGLLTLRAAVYLAAMGRNGLNKVARLCMQKAHYLAEQLCAIQGVSLLAQAPFFNEFTLRLPTDAENLLQKMADHNMLAGITCSEPGKENLLTVAVTEKRTAPEIENYIKLFKNCI